MKNRFSEEQILKILQEADKSPTVEGVCRKNNISKTTFYQTKTPFPGQPQPLPASMAPLAPKQKTSRSEEKSDSNMPKANFCPECGGKIEANSAFCPECGKKKK